MRLEKDYDPFGMLMVGRNWVSGSENYRYGFNGKEQDDETYGDGNVYDYGFRIYNPRLGKFLSVDPLTKSYAMLSPYQYASNNPIFYVDIDGLEGISYRVIEQDETEGTTTVLRREISLDIHIAVTTDGSTQTALSGETIYGYTKEQSMQLQNILIEKFSEKSYFDEAGVEVQFKLNFIEADLSETNPETKAMINYFQSTPTNYTSNTDVDIDGSYMPFESVTGIFFWQQDMPAESTYQLSGNRGVTDATNLDLPGSIEFGYAEAQIITTFMLSGYGSTQETPTTIDDKEALGGWMASPQYEWDSDGGYYQWNSPGEFNLSDEAAQKIIQGVPRTNDKVEGQ